MKRTGIITTSNARINRLINNILWGQKSNFVDIPTDCPQRDERLGWTGDINAFCNAATYNYDIRLFMKKWLNDVRNDQKETGEIPHVVPDCLNDSKHTNAMWCECIVMIPWNMYWTYGDKSFLEDNYLAMKKFISAREKTMKNGLIYKGNEFGDWLALDQEVMSTETIKGRTDPYYITNIFQVNDLKILMEIAKVLNKEEDEILYRQKYETMLTKVREEYFTLSGKLCYDTITAQVLALYFDIVPSQFKEKLAKELNDNMIKHCYEVVTGFICTTFCYLHLQIMDTLRPREECF